MTSHKEEWRVVPQQQKSKSEIQKRLLGFFRNDTEKIPPTIIYESGTNEGPDPIFICVFLLLHFVCLLFLVVLCVVLYVIYLSLLDF